MRRNIMLLSILTLLVALVAGCTQLGPQATPVPPTKTPKPTFTFTPNWSPTPLVLPSATPIPATPTPEATATPAVTDTPTQVPVPRFTASRTANVRNGPGTNYVRIGALGAGEAGVITGKNPAGNWYQFDYDGRPGWVSADLVTVSGDTASIQVAQNIPVPPTPRPRPTSPPPPTAQPQAPAAPPAPTYDWMYVQGSANPAPQCGVPNFEGQVQYRDGSPQNGVCVYIDYYGPRQIKFSGSGGKGNGNWGFSPCGQGDCKGPFVIYVVECPSGIGDGGVNADQIGFAPAPKSDKFTATITDKCSTGQWTHIIFKGTK
jgi:hypothetical protein